MAGSSWTDQLVNLIILSAAQRGFSGFFVYSPAPGAGNLIGSWAAAAGTDQYGNAYPAGLSVKVGAFSGTSLFLYSGTPAVGNLIASAASAPGSDGFGNHYVSGFAAYAAAFASSLNAGFVQFYSGSLAGGWSASATIETDSLGDIILLAASGRSVTTNNNTLDDGAGNAAIAGTLTIGGSSNTGSGNNGGVTSGPSGTVNAFPAAGPNHTHAEVHQHPL